MTGLEVLIAGAFVSLGVGTATAGYLAAATLLAISIGVSIGLQAIFKPSQPKPSDGQVIIRQSAAARFRSYGRVKVSGVLMFANTGGPPGALHRVIAMGQGEIDGVEEHWFDDRLITGLTPGGGMIVSGPYAGIAWIDFHYGSDAGYRFLNLESAFPGLWTAAHLGKGVAAAHVLTQQVDAEDMSLVYPNGQANYRQVQRGAKVRNLSAGAFEAPAWSDNAALVIADYLTHPDGLNLADLWILAAVDSWYVAAGACDDVVPVTGGGTEARYRIWNTYRFDERPGDVLARFLQACDGILTPTPGGGLALSVGKWVAPTVTIDDDAIVSFNEIKRGGDILTTANTIRARFTDPNGDYLEADAVPWIDAADVAARGEFATDFDFFCAPSHNQCRRLMKIQAHRLNPSWSGTVVCNLRAMPIMGERFAVLTCAELGIAGETIEIVNVELIVEATILSGVSIQFRSMSAAAYEWAGDMLLGTRSVLEPPPMIVPGDSTVPPPTGLAVLLLNDSTRAQITWDEPPQTYFGVEVRMRRADGVEHLPIPVAPGGNATMIDGLTAGTEYVWEARHRSSTTSRASAWVAAPAPVLGEPADALF